MACSICGEYEYIIILNKEKIPIWTGSSLFEEDVYVCELRQCIKCGHVYEELAEDLMDKLIKIYSSSHAQASTAPGEGSWGLKRAEFFLNKIDYKNHNTAIEIGCADGYLLKFLENNGYQKLIGIEPSLLQNSTEGKIEFINDFVNEKTSLGHKVDLIFSNAVFEHIKDMNGILQFAKNHLNDAGELFFAVPNAEKELEEGDPALFIHEHVHYYTENVLRFMLAKNGFEMQFIKKECSALYVSAKISNNIEIEYYPITLYKSYEKKLAKKIKNFITMMNMGKKVIIHGANNKLNNILGFARGSYKFTLIDNDEKKHNKDFFGQKVLRMDDINVNDYDIVLIVPTCFYKEIQEEYKKRSFKGVFKFI